ncbi:MAG: hypothetical protein PHW69_09670, partial [Elusimicrobiaceae bacterium]|nr:hypothetical protein [Elusimicrobiaceae bacterium]
ATNPPATLAGIPETTPPMNMQMPQQMGGMPGMMPPATNPPATSAGIPETAPPMNMQMPQQMGGMPGMMPQQMGGMPGMIPQQMGGMPGMMPQQMGGMPGMMPQQMGGMPGMMPQQMGGMPGMMPQQMGGMPGMMSQQMGGYPMPMQAAESTQQMLQMMSIISALQQDIRNLQQEKMAALAKLNEQPRPKPKPKADTFGFGGGDDAFGSDGGSGFEGEAAQDFESGPGFAAGSNDEDASVLPEPEPEIEPEPVRAEPEAAADVPAAMPEPQSVPEPEPAPQMVFEAPASAVAPEPAAQAAAPEPAPAAAEPVAQSIFEISASAAPAAAPASMEPPKIESSFRLATGSEPEAKPAPNISVALPMVEDSFRFQRGAANANPMDTLGMAVPTDSAMVITEVNRKGRFIKKLVRFFVSLVLMLAISLVAAFMLAKFNVLPAKYNPFVLLSKRGISIPGVKLPVPVESAEVAPAAPEINQAEVIGQIKAYVLPSGKSLEELVRATTKAPDTEIEWAIQLSSDNAYAISVKVPPSEPNGLLSTYQFNYKISDKALNPANPEATRLLESVVPADDGGKAADKPVAPADGKPAAKQAGGGKAAAK